MRTMRAFELAGWMGVLLMSVTGTLWAEEPSKTLPAEKALWQRYLQGEDASMAAEQEKQLAMLQEAGKFEEALKVAEGLVELRSQAQGADHWQVVNARSAVEALRRVLRQENETQTAYAGMFALYRQAQTLLSQGHYKEAQPLLEKVLVINRKVLGKVDPIV